MSEEYDRIRTYTVNQVLKYVSLNPEDAPKTINFSNIPVYMGSKRYLNFKAHGQVCVNCGLKGTYFALEKHKGQKSDSYHFNLYGKDKNGVEVMLTKDHIRPKAKGGSDDLSNLQPMCVKCNSEKGNKWLSHKQEIYKATYEEVSKNIYLMEQLMNKLNNRLNNLKEKCPHDIIIKKDGTASCSICKKVFGRYCSKSPEKVCITLTEQEKLSNKDVVYKSPITGKIHKFSKKQVKLAVPGECIYCNRSLKDFFEINNIKEIKDGN